MRATYLTAGALVALMRLTWPETWRKKKICLKLPVLIHGREMADSLLCISYKLKPLLFLRRNSEAVKRVSITVTSSSVSAVVLPQFKVGSDFFPPSIYMEMLSDVGSHPMELTCGSHCLFSLHQVLLVFLKMEEEGENMFPFLFHHTAAAAVLLKCRCPQGGCLGEGPNRSRHFSLGFAKEKRECWIIKAKSFTGFMV